MKRPYIICHMMSAVNGKILPATWNTALVKEYSKLYEECHNSFNSQGWIVGRVTMEKDFSKGEKPVLNTPAHPIERKPFIGDTAAESFAVAIDASGKLGWKTNEIGGDHLIEVLTEGVSDAYLSYLQQRNISYLFAGKNELDLETAMEQLYSVFNIKNIMLEGGGHINGSMATKGLIDELSILVVPVADATPATPTTFELTQSGSGRTAAQMELKQVQQLNHGVVWLTYSFQ